MSFNKHILILVFYSPTFFDRFDQSTKENILAFILGSALKLSDYGKVSHYLLSP